jgi:hypothetical protein
MAILSMESQSSMFMFFKASKLPYASAGQISSLVHHWFTHKGPEWTIERLKGLRSQLLKYHCDIFEFSVKSHKDGTPFGPFRYIFSQPLEVGLKVLSIYTCYKSETVTKKQATKFLSSVNSPEFSGDYEIGIEDTIYGFVTQFINEYKGSHPLTFIRSERSAPTVDESGIITSIPENFLSFERLFVDIVKAGPSTKKLLWRHRVLLNYTTSVSIKSLYTKLDYDPSTFDAAENYKLSQLPPIGGSIGLIMEKGGKLRSVANPFRLYQCALQPIGDLLYFILKRLPWDCTHDQQSGIDFVAQKISEKQIIYSFDLSNATDKFPLSIQIQLLRNLISKRKEYYSSRADNLDLILEDSIELLLDIARSRWYSPKLRKFHKDGDYIKWKNGQPLGLYPSFGLFALTHGLLLRSFERTCKVSDVFRIVGDDVIITDSAVAEKYTSFMKLVNVEIHPTKSIISDKLSEFLGTVILQDKIIKPMKWQHYVKGNPFGPLLMIGWKGLFFYPHKDRKLMQSLMSLPEPVGLGLNPLGLSLSERLEGVIDFYDTPAYETIPSFSLSHSDVENNQNSFWRSAVIPEQASLFKYCNQPDQESLMIPISHDSMRVLHFPQIEEYNASIRGIKCMDLVSIPKPDTKDLPLLPDRGDPRKVKKIWQPFRFLLKVYRTMRKAKT